MEQMNEMEPRPTGPATEDPARWRHTGRRWWLGKMILCLLVLPLLGVVVMLLWNWVMPPTFPGVNPIGFWRAVGLLALCRILFGGFRGRHGGWHEKRRFMRARWEAMTPEERERCGRRGRMFCRGRGER
ncbi:MAG TPA: hypothetical protein VE092_19945 [Herbaspirillum sp.]|uniref:hypothetical protein n=1 Tax=Herbaspirillum sp. TaxID=1890675 RepID=UPI002D7604B6|nr:hypothetical protein [Herbaspirillum sp.]HZG22294.1 hypothetical protein [Herbaspirillum sp.]